MATPTAPVASPRTARRPREHGDDGALAIPDDLTTLERELLGDLFAIIEEHADEVAEPIDRKARRARVRVRLRAPRRPAPRVRRGLHHPPGRRREDLRGHAARHRRRCAPRCCTTRSRTRAPALDEVREEFGDEVAGLVDGVTKLTGITFQSRDEAQAENYRKMMVAMATDIRVILIKLADRLHNMRTLGAMPKQKQIEKAKETLEIYAPLAHRLGIHAIKWELEDLAFATLHPRKYQEIKGLVNQQREERERYVAKAGGYLDEGARGARHPRRDLRPREALLLDLLEDDQEGPRVQRDLRPHGHARDRRLREGLLRRGRRHPLALEAAPRPLQGLGGDAEVQHVPGAPHDGDRARGAAARDPDPHARHARDGRVRRRRALALQGGHARDGRHRRRPTPSSSGSSRLLDWQQDAEDPQEFTDELRGDLFEDEVFVFTPKGEVKSLAAGATPLDFAYEIHTDVGHRCVGAKVNGKIVPLHYELQSGDIVEVLTSKRERGPSRDWLALVKTTRARNKIRAWFKAESREDSEHAGRELLQEHLNKAGLPAQKMTGSPLLADVIREMGFKKADDFYIALGGAKISPKVVVNKVMQRLKQGEAGVEEPTAGRATCSPSAARRRARRPDGDASKYGIQVEGVDDVLLRLAKCCRPVSGDPIVGYVSLGARHHDPPRGLPERRRAAQGPRALRAGGLGRRQRDRRSRSSSRSTPGTATACSRTSRARSPRPASTSSRRAASSRTRWSRTASSSRWGTRRR